MILPFTLIYKRLIALESMFKSDNSDDPNLKYKEREHEVSAIRSIYLKL